MSETIEARQMLDELKQFVVLHSRAQALPEALLRYSLKEIGNDEAGAPASWTAVWSRVASEAAGRGDALLAMRLYNMARFPCLSDTPRVEAHARCLHAFEQWRSQSSGVERFRIEGDAESFVIAAGLDRDRPLLVVTGGIVSIKEQWHDLLAAATRLGYAVVLGEMPGVGENRQSYDGTNREFFPAIIERMRGHADIGRTHLLALSFSGHLALRAAVAEPRIRSITTVGAPISRFFETVASAPLVTRAVLAWMLGCGISDLADRLRTHSLTGDELASCGAEVNYVASRRDEIIPMADVDDLRTHAARLRVLAVDDVHGAPNHLRLTRLFVVASMLRGRRRDMRVLLAEGALRLAARTAGGTLART